MYRLSIISWDIVGFCLHHVLQYIFSSHVRTEEIYFGDIIIKRMRLTRILSPKTFRLKSFSQKRQKPGERILLKLYPFSSYYPLTGSVMTQLNQTRISG
jgi:hypothetical protein